MVLLKKNGGKSLPGDQVIIPKFPDKIKEPDAYKAWYEKYGECNGIMEAVYPEGFSPFDYERRSSRKPAVVDNGKMGVVIRKFGEKLDDGQVLADPDRNRHGPLPFVSACPLQRIFKSLCL